MPKLVRCLTRQTLCLSLFVVVVVVCVQGDACADDGAEATRDYESSCYPSLRRQHCDRSSWIQCRHWPPCPRPARHRLVFSCLRLNSFGACLACFFNPSILVLGCWCACMLLLYHAIWCIHAHQQPKSMLYWYHAILVCMYALAVPCYIDASLCCPSRLLRLRACVVYVCFSGSGIGRGAKKVCADGTRRANRSL